MSRLLAAKEHVRVRQRRVGAQVLWGYDQTLLVLRAKNENTAFLMKYAARPERGITVKHHIRRPPLRTCPRPRPILDLTVAP